MSRELVSHDLAWIMQHAEKLPNGCWQWTGAKTEKGYGQVHDNIPPRKSYRAHRLVWGFVHGPIPPEMQVLHRCDNPSCVNPDHLFLGTNADNMRDKENKGRGTKPPRLCGEQHPQHKLTWDQVREIRRLRAAGGYSQKELATRFNISDVVVSKIVLGQLWCEE